MNQNLNLANEPRPVVHKPSMNAIWWRRWRRNCKHNVAPSLEFGGAEFVWAEVDPQKERTYGDYGGRATNDRDKRRS